MGIGSEEFERRFGSVLDSHDAAGSRSLLIGDLYLNRRLGLAFTKPSGWVFEHASKVSEVAMGRILNPDFGWVNRLMVSLTDEYLPIVTVAAPPRSDNVDRAGDLEVRPVITVHVEGGVAESGDQDGAFSLLEHVREDVSNFGSWLKGYEVERAPTPTNLPGCSGVKYRASYLYVHESVPDPVPVRELALYVLQGSLLYETRMCDFPNKDARLTFDFNEFMRSICLM